MNYDPATMRFIDDGTPDAYCICKPYKESPEDEALEQIRIKTDELLQVLDRTKHLTAVESEPYFDIIEDIQRAQLDLFAECVVLLKLRHHRWVEDLI